MTSERLTDSTLALLNDKLEDQARHFREIFEYMPVAYQSLDIEGNYIDANELMAKMLGYDNPAELMGKSFGDFWSTATCSMFPKTFGGLKQTGHVNADLHLKRRDGSTLIAQIAGCTQRTVNGEFVRTHCALLDVSERRAMEAQLMSLNQSLEARVEERTVALHQAQEARRNFLAVVSHELRTPLNAIVGLASLLEDPSLPASTQNTVARIQTATESLHKLIGGILDFSRIDAQEMSLQTAPFDLGSSLAEIRDLFADMATGKGLTLTISDSPIAEALVGDRTRLKQVLINLVANAIKFTDRGEVALTVTPVLRGKDKSRLRFAVRDTGCGIAPEQFGHIFEPFIRGGQTDNGYVQGVGLGLAISKRLLGLMDVELHVSSQQGEGTTFWFEAELTLAPALTLPEAVATPISAPDAQPAIRVILAEDDETNRHVTERVLSRRGCEVHTAADGLEALATLEILANQGEMPDVLLLDLEMPRLNGLETIRRVRDNPLYKSLPILVLSGNALNSRQKEVLAAGATAFLFKPISPTQLMAAIAQYRR